MPQIVLRSHRSPHNEGRWWAPRTCNWRRPHVVELSMLAEKADNQEKSQKEKAKEAKKVKSLLSDFYAYKRHSIRIGNEDFIRVSQDGQNVETSQNVSVPIDDARKLYKAIQSSIDIKGYKIGNYTVNSLNGVLTIGCHRINIDSVHRTGNQIA